jgi:acyl-CoA thioesterase-1
MKRTLTFLTTLLLAPLAFAASSPAAKSAPPVAKEFAPIVDDPKLPRVLIIGDSVSVAYTLDVRKNLAGVANVHRIAANGGSTRTALGEYGLIRWLKPGEKWDVIHFNEGLHDLSYRFPDDRDKNDKGEYASPTNGGRPNVSLEQYEKNLRLIVARLKQTGAKLIFASTTPVPESDAAKYVKDSELPYNVVAKKVMTEEGVIWNDLWAAVKPKQDQLQGKRNVHFMAAGSAVLAKQVAEAITRELPKRSSK